MRADDLFTTITAQLIDDIESGNAGTWRMPWHTVADAATPTNVDGRPYRGLNALWLPLVAGHRGWDSGMWGTYRSWQAHGAQVRRGAVGEVDEERARLRSELQLLAAEPAFLIGQGPIDDLADVIVGERLQRDNA